MPSRRKRSRSGRKRSESRRSRSKLSRKRSRVRSRRPSRGPHRRYRSTVPDGMVFVDVQGLIDEFTHNSLAGSHVSTQYVLTVKKGDNKEEVEFPVQTNVSQYKDSEFVYALGGFGHATIEPERAYRPNVASLTDELKTFIITPVLHNGEPKFSVSFGGDYSLLQLTDLREALRLYGIEGTLTEYNVFMFPNEDGWEVFFRFPKSGTGAQESIEDAIWPYKRYNKEYDLSTFIPYRESTSIGVLVPETESRAREREQLQMEQIGELRAQIERIERARSLQDLMPANATRRQIRTQVRRLQLKLHTDKTNELDQKLQYSAAEALKKLNTLNDMYFKK